MPLKNWVTEQLLARRPAISCLLFSGASLFMLLVFAGLHAYALSTPSALQAYHPEGLVWVQRSVLALAAYLLGVMLYCWRQGRSEQPFLWLRLLTVTSTILFFIALSIAYGLKDTPMCVVLLAMVLLGRALFDGKTLMPSLVLGVSLVLANELWVEMGWAHYAPLLSRPVFTAEPLSAWWLLWCQVLFYVGVAFFSAMVFFLFGVLDQRRRELEALVRTDVLTGLANRRTFMAQLDIERHRHARTKRAFCILMCDVDHFKRINDTWGHPAGDEVLVVLGRILNEAIRDQVDTAARIGGEEFAVLLPETELSQATAVAEKIADQVRAHRFVVDGQAFHVTQSIGIAEAAQGDGDAAMRVADDNLYRAKRQGRDCIVASVV